MPKRQKSGGPRAPLFLSFCDFCYCFFSPGLSLKPVGIRRQAAVPQAHGQCSCVVAVLIVTSQEATLKAKVLIALAAAATLALPLTAQAQADKAKSDGGAEAMFKALDKDNDGSISKEEAKGTPHDKDFAQLDKNKDGKLSREEHAAAPEHSGSAAAGKTGSGSKY